MIHPINIPEDLLSANPSRPQFFKQPKPKQQIRYSADGRRLDANGAALQPISPNHYWNDVFMRAFIRRLMPADQEAKTAAAAAAETKGTEFEQQKNQMPSPTARNANLSQHVDIVDFSPSASTPVFPSFSSFANLEFDEMENADAAAAERKCSNISLCSSNSSGNLTPDRPPTSEVSSTTSTDEEEAADGDALARIGSSARMPQRAQRVSRKAIRAMLAPCCGAVELGMEEFARLDFSHVDLFGQQNNGKVLSGDFLLELIASEKGSRIWTTTKNSLKTAEKSANPHPQRDRTTIRQNGTLKKRNEEKNAVAADAVPSSVVPFIQFHINAVRVEVAKEVVICLEAHTAALPMNPVQFQIETHLHCVNVENGGGSVIGNCLAVITQTEYLRTGQTPICIKIALSEQMHQQLATEHKNANVFLMATMQGKLLVPSTAEK